MNRRIYTINKLIQYKSQFYRATEDIKKLNDFLQTVKSVTKEENALKALELLTSPTNSYLDELKIPVTGLTAVLAVHYKDISVEDLLKDNKSNGVLVEAIFSGFTEVVDLMLSKGIGVNSKILDDNRPLHFAATNGQLELVKLLLDRGAAVDAPGLQGLTAAGVAASKGYLEVLKTLLDSGANVHAVAKNGISLLHFAIQGVSHPTAKQTERQQIIKFLLEKGADINAKDKSNMTPLHFAVTSKYELAKLLLNSGADTEVTEINNKMTPLFGAVLKGDGEIVKLLLEHGANISAQDDGGNTVLHRAIVDLKENEKIVEILINNGAKIDLRNEKGFSPLHSSVNMGIIKIVEMILNCEGDVNILIENDGDYNGFSALSIAALTGQEDIVRMLINYGADIDIQDEYGATPLSLASMEGNQNIVKMLLDISIVVQLPQLTSPLLLALYIVQPCRDKKKL